MCAARGIVVHHTSRPPEVPDDLYEYIFTLGAVGDWWWNVDEDGVRVLWLIVPDPARQRGQGVLGDRSSEAICVYPSHIEGNWAIPGDVNGWDGNEDEPTLSPSIYVGGGTKQPGWHGFFERGRLRTVG